MPVWHCRLALLMRLPLALCPQPPRREKVIPEATAWFTGEALMEYEVSSFFSIVFCPQTSCREAAGLLWLAAAGIGAGMPLPRSWSARRVAVGCCAVSEGGAPCCSRAVAGAVAVQAAPVLQLLAAPHTPLRCGIVFRARMAMRMRRRRRMRRVMRCAAWHAHNTRVAMCACVQWAQRALASFAAQ